MWLYHIAYLKWKYIHTYIQLESIYHVPGIKVGIVNEIHNNHRDIIFYKN